VSAERLAQCAAMHRKRVRIPLLAQVVQQLRRALHVGEEKGDISGGKVAAHMVSMRDESGTVPSDPALACRAYGVSRETNSLAESVASVFVNIARNWLPAGDRPA
jgi:hypothetical protein